MPTPRDVTVTVELTDAQALALAQLVKRFYYVDAEKLAVDQDETELMMAAVTRLQRALGEAGYAPR